MQQASYNIVLSEGLTMTDKLQKNIATALGKSLEELRKGSSKSAAEV